MIITQNIGSGNHSIADDDTSCIFDAKYNDGPDISLSIYKNGLLFNCQSSIDNPPTPIIGPTISSLGIQTGHPQVFKKNNQLVFPNIWYHWAIVRRNTIPITSFSITNPKNNDKLTITIENNYILQSFEYFPIIIMITGATDDGSNNSIKINKSHSVISIDNNNIFTATDTITDITGITAYGSIIPPSTLYWDGNRIVDYIDYTNHISTSILIGKSTSPKTIIENIIQFTDIPSIDKIISIDVEETAGGTGLPINITFTDGLTNTPNITIDLQNATTPQLLAQAFIDAVNGNKNNNRQHFRLTG